MKNKRTISEYRKIIRGNKFLSNLGNGKGSLHQQEIDDGYTNSDLSNNLTMNTPKLLLKIQGSKKEYARFEESLRQEGRQSMLKEVLENLDKRIEDWDTGGKSRYEGVSGAVLGELEELKASLSSSEGTK